jgi:hypothetical protein
MLAKHADLNLVRVLEMGFGGSFCNLTFAGSPLRATTRRRGRRLL